MSYLIDYLINLAASFTFVLVVIVFGWILIRRKRKRLLLFFGVKESGRLNLWFSLLRIIPGGAIGADGAPRSFGGNALPSGELEFLPLYQRLFNYIVPALQEQPGFWRNILLSDLQIEAAPSPVNPADVQRSSSLVSFGSPGYNSVSFWVENSLQSLGHFIQQNSAIELSGVPQFADPLDGFVQRVRIGDGPAVAFYVAGMSEQATKASAYYLAAHWQLLQGAFGNRQNFCIVLKADTGDYRKCVVLLERRER